jgi:UDP-N-acetylglucosamine--N-acetylmuramyl-(pentapeptide) pyrophosphoryl-undecaprenol N-acetylglucosamine transferase
MRVALAAAGTAGHYLKSVAPDIESEFLGSSSALDSSLLQSTGFTLKPVTKAPLPRKISPSLLSWPFKFIQSLMQLSRYLDGCDLVIGFGGYVCAPTYLIAKSKKIPILIHEANAKPGMANDLGRRLGAHLTTAFESTGRNAPRWMRATLVGMPVRSAVQELAQIDRATREEIRIAKAQEWNFDEKRPIILVFGGSQGSRAINTVIADILGETERIGIQIVHAVGRANSLPERRKNYLPIHYISDMAESMIASDLAITRGGAVTCSELGILRTYGVIVPLAIGNGEQSFNAQELTRIGGGVIIQERDFTARLLSEQIFTLIKSAREYRATHQTPAFPLDAEVRLGRIALNLVQRGH